MWVFSDNTIAGDLGVTPIIQCLASMLITSTLVHSDLHASSIKPLPYVYPHVEHLPDPRLLLSRSYRKQMRDAQAESNEKPNQIATPETRGLSYYYWMLIRFIFEGTERNMLLARPGLKNWFGRFLWTAAQGAGIGIIFGFPIWCLAIIILGPIYGNGNMGNKWAPQVIKLVYGAIVGWVTNPVIAILALGSQADHHLIMVEHDEEETTGGEPTTNAQGEVDETIHEDQEYTHSSTRSPIPLPSSPGISTSPLVRPTIPSRPRAISSLSSSSRHRPPLTANVSRLSPLPPASIDLPLERPVYGRERGLTVSSMGSQYSYALVGPGGRAKRPRAESSVSLSAPVFGGDGDKAAVAVPQVMVSRPSQDLGSGRDQRPEGLDGRPRAGSGDVFGRPSATGGRARSASTLAALGEVKEQNQD
jgi:hypothetical protein